MFVFFPQAIADIVDAYSRVGCNDPEVVDALVAKVAANPSGLSGEALAKLVTATIQLGCEDERLLGQLLDAMVDKVGEISPGAIVKLVAALGELGLCHRTLLDALTSQAVPERLAEFQQTELVNMIGSLNQLGYYNQKFTSLVNKFN